MARSWPLAIVATLVAATLVGCARHPAVQSSGTPDQTPNGSATTAPPTPTPTRGGGGSSGGGPGGLPGGLPTPSEPPMTASDQLPTDVVVGTVKVATSGPCYLIETDDGVAYALYGSGGTVGQGQRVRAKVEPLTQVVSCGPGIRAHIVTLDVSA